MEMGENKILLIEDNEDHAELIIDILEIEYKKEVILIKDGQEAIDYFRKACRPEPCKASPLKQSVTRADFDGDNEAGLEIDLVILDLNLPKVHGMDILKFIKQNSMYSSIPVIILSTSSDDKTIKEAYENGANGYITKPISYEDFVEKIKILISYCNKYDHTKQLGN
jgi:two-component system, response regulator